jgi:putative ABC transport system permease protein
MKIPISYNLRNLVVRKTTTVMTLLGIALPVGVLVAALALANGLKTAFRTSGNPSQVIVLRKGSESELGSSIDHETYQDLEWLPGIAHGRAAQPMASLEMVNVVNLPSVDDPDGMNITLRGLSPVGIEMREVKISVGRWFLPGQQEIIVGASVAKRYPGARLGHELSFGGGRWRVVGVMNAAEAAANSEIWGDLNQIASAYNRPDQFNSVLIRATSPAEVPSLIHAIDIDHRLDLLAEPETSYYQKLTSAGSPVEFLGIFVALIMAVGSSFAAMNTTYAAVAKRTAEIGTLRVLGFSSASILGSFLIESLLLALAGGVAGCLLALPLNGMTTAIGSFTTFSEFTFQFRIGLGICLAGIGLALFVGSIGGVFPARIAARKPVVEALKEG